MQSADQVKKSKNFILLAVFIYSVGFGIIMPVLPELIIELENVSLPEATLWAGYIGACYAIFQFLMGPLMGSLGDKYGRRPIFLISLCAFGLDFLLMGFAPSIIWLFIGRAIAGGLGAIFGPANAAMADLSDDNDRAKSFGMVGAAFGVGFIIGPAIGGFLGDWGTRIPFFVAGFLALAVSVYGYFNFPETIEENARRNIIWKQANPLGTFIKLAREKNILPIASIYFIWICATNIYPASWTFYATAQFGWGSQMIGISLTIVGISMVITQMFIIGRMVNRYGERMTALIGLSFAILGFSVMSQITNGYLALMISAAMGIQGVIMPSLNALMSRRTSRSNQGELQGFNGSMAALALLIAQLSYNGLLSYFTSDEAPFRFAGAPFILAAFFAIISLIMLLSISKKNSQAS